MHLNLCSSRKKLMSFSGRKSGSIRVNYHFGSDECTFSRCKKQTHFQEIKIVAGNWLVHNCFMIFQVSEADVVDRLMSCIRQAAPLFSVSNPLI